MKPDSTALITVMVNDTSFDMELPLFVSVAELKTKLSETFNGLGLAVNDIKLTTIDGVAIDNFCLAHFGVWDGGIIKVA